MSRLGKSLLIAAFLLAAAGCHYSSDTPAVPTKPVVTSSDLRSVPVMRPQRHTVVESIELPGDLVGFYEAALHSKVTGYLVKMNVDKGDWVKTGQILAVIEVPELQHNLERDQATMQINKLTWQRLDRVRKTDPRLVAKETVDIAYAKYQEAKSSVGALETMVSYTKIIAPFDGVITGRFADPGALIRAGGGDFGLSGSGAPISSGATEGAGGHLTGGGPVLTEAAISKLRVYIYIPERQAGMVRIGMPASMTLRSFPGKVFHATVTRYASSLDLATRTMLTEIDIDNANHQLYPRMYADVTLTLVQHPNALEVPRGAVSGLGQPTSYIYTVRNGKLRKTPVTTGLSDGTNIEITSGLTDTDEVVTRMSPSLAAGEPVKILAEATQESGASEHGD
ncbi:MAG TPA: efflux RND transporter periplasmic adaptor subunit [Candidatus Binataceae bacterium]|nr:efflux RND transporter periplasmic adaptor subunit [Candidatus Binataceae bacterium]